MRRGTPGVQDAGSTGFLSPLHQIPRCPRYSGRAGASEPRLTSLVATLRRGSTRFPKCRPPWCHDHKCVWFTRPSISPGQKYAMIDCRGRHAPLLYKRAKQVLSPRGTSRQGTKCSNILLLAIIKNSKPQHPRVQPSAHTKALTAMSQIFSFADTGGRALNR